MPAHSDSKPVFTAHKAWAGAGASGLFMLAAQSIGPDAQHQSYAAVVLLSALFSPWTGAAIDADLLSQAVKALWAAIIGGAGVHQAVYWMPNQLKALVPLMKEVLAGYQPKPDGREAAPPPKSPSGNSPLFPPSATLGVFIGLFLALALLSGCATGTDSASGPLQKLAEDAQEVEDKGAAHKLADDLLGEAQGPDHRQVRLCMIFAGVSELMVDRVVKTDADYAPEAYGHIVALQSIAKNLDASGANTWFETDVKLATLTLADILVEVGKDRVPRLLSNLTGGVNVLGIAERARVAARQAELAGAVIRDVKAAMARIGKDGFTAEDARRACDDRLTKNRDRLGAITGAN